MMRWAAAALGALTLGLAATARGQERVRDEIDLESLYRLADASPRLAALAALAEAGEGDVTTAGTPPNPSLSFDVLGFLGGEETNGGTQQQLAVAQTFPWPGQLDHRVRAARARLAADRAGVSLERATLRLAIRRAFVLLLAAQERSRLLAEQASTLERVSAIVRGRAESGAGRRWDVVRLDSELAAVQAARGSAAADETVAAGRIASLVGRPGWLPRASGRLEDLVADLPSSGAAMEQHPALTVARRVRDAAAEGLAREEAYAFPSFDLRLGAVATTRPEGAYLYGGLSIPLSFFDRNQGAIERAHRELDAARLAEEAMTAHLSASSFAARRALEQRRAALAAFATGVMERLPQILEMGEIAYRGGEIGVFELIDLVRSTRTVQMERVEREEDVRLAEVDVIEAVMGAPRDE